MSVGLSFIAGAGWQFFDNNGVPLAGGKLFVYAAGTTTKSTTYTSNTGLTPNTNPIILDSAGRVSNEIWLTEGSDYKFVLSPSTDTDPPTNAIWTKDDIPVVNDVTSVLADLANTTDNSLGDALVGFKQSNSSGFLSGAVARTVNAKLQELVSVKDFGATGDGITDDTTYIQSAITAAQNSIGTLFFPPGTYLVSSLTVSGSLVLTGSGTASVIKQKDSSAGSMFSVTGTGNNVVFQELTFDGNQAGQTTASYNYNSIIFSTATGGTYSDAFTLLVQDCEFRNPTYAAVRVKGDNTATTREIAWIVNCRFLNGRTGIEAVSGDYTPRDIDLNDAVKAFVVNNVFTSDAAPVSFGRAAIVVAQTQTANIRFTEAYIVGNDIEYRGVAVTQSIGAIDLYIWATYSVVRDNTLKNITAAGIKWKADASYVSVINNKLNTLLASPPVGASALPAISGNQAGYGAIGHLVIVEGNQIAEWSGATGGVIVVEGYYSVSGAYSDGLTIRNNQLYNCSGYQIQAATTKNVTIEGNQIYPNLGTNGIMVSNANTGIARITNNYIGACSNYSISTNSSNNAAFEAIVENNVIVDCSSAYYAVDIAARRIVFSNNYIFNCYFGALLDPATELVATGNLIQSLTGPTPVGILVEGTASTTAIVTGNDATGVSKGIFYNIDIATKRDTGNSWNWASAAPSLSTVGYYKVGDVVYNTAPASAGYIGWVCTVAGTPGTWKTFGLIS